MTSSRYEVQLSNPFANLPGLHAPLRAHFKTGKTFLTGNCQAFAPETKNSFHSILTRNENQSINPHSNDPHDVGKPESKLLWRVVENRMLALEIDFAKGEFRINKTPMILECQHPTDPGETGLRVWDAGVVLAKYLGEVFVPKLFTREISEFNVKNDKKVKIVELGCGTGIAGIACALSGVKCEVMLTDRQIIEDATRKNIRLNSDSIKKAGALCTFQVLDWLEIDRIALRFHNNTAVDLIVASDVLWSESFVKPFVATLKKISSPTTRIVICQKIRSPELDEFWLNEIACDFVMVSKIASTSVLDAAFSSEKVYLYEFRLR